MAFGIFTKGLQVLMDFVMLMGEEVQSFAIVLLATAFS